MKIISVCLVVLIVMCVFFYPDIPSIPFNKLTRYFQSVDPVPPIFFDWGGILGDILGVLTFGFRFIPWLLDQIFSFIAVFIPALDNQGAFGGIGSSIVETAISPNV